MSQLITARFLYEFAYGGGIANTIGIVWLVYSGHYFAAFLCGIGLLFAILTVAQGKPTTK